MISVEWGKACEQFEGVGGLVDREVAAGHDMRAFLSRCGQQRRDQRRVDGVGDP
ncbi:hypothetical protein ABIA45_006126 [Bradyrhizobium sp. USDA 336]